MKNMFGVVLWSDVRAQTAVVWCEDHGNLAYYTAHGTSAMEGVSLDPGDLIQFELREDGETRHVRNPQIVGASLYPNLPAQLQSVANGEAPKSAAQKNKRRNWFRPANLPYTAKAGPKMA